MVDWLKIAEEVKLFCETVTIRGVARIVKSKRIVVAVLWLVAVITCSSFLIWQLCLLFVKYFTFPITTTITEQDVDPVFPTVTICNLNPILMVKKEYTDLLSWSQHLKNVEHALNNTNYDALAQYYPNIPKKDAQNLVRDLESPGGYFANFQVFNQKNDTDVSKDLIVDSSLVGWDWVRSNASVDILDQWDSNYYNCFKTEIKSQNRGNIRSMSLILYINNFPTALLPGQYQLGSLTSKATGVRITIHLPGTRGEMKNGLNLSPGTESTLYIQMVNRSRLHYPYSADDCTDDFNFTPNISGYFYSREDCTDYCIQQKVVDVCKCLSLEHLSSKSQQQKASYTFCGNMSNIGGSDKSLASFNGPKNSANYYSNTSKVLPEFVKMLACQKSILMNESNSCLNACKVPCKEVYYDYRSLYADWPDVTQHLSVYRSYVRNTTSRMVNASLFEAYDELDSQVVKGSMDEKHAIDKLKQLDLIKNNFLQINIVFESDKPYIVKDEATMTSITMLSSVGGSLSLWLGITIMTLAEVAEFIFNLIVLSVGRKKEIQPKRAATVIKSMPPDDKF
ncbi:hypothetical protein HELRODRAFT_161791 [Helobdella robusta]|uniref:Uncharacterized protein n=1 Tax=Helobdella robusta TaxID=6412 RepID=T1ERX2_HELRO|nr:hypothetical protein HELRODRAFT_161791 [Helobdella robusta]ESO02513.1 hypothetical protein HELRODRAFT_161791 [Helobdella robusta]